MAALFAPGSAAAIFGPRQLAPEPDPPALHLIQARSDEAYRRRLRAECPNRPGVYGMLDADGNLIYVGKSKQLRTRLLSYCRDDGQGRKERRIIERTRTLVWELAPAEFSALLRELELIQRWRPVYNVLGQPGYRDHTYICLGKRPVSQVFLSKQPGTDAFAWFGPVPQGTRAREAVRRLNDWFGLRDCPKQVPLGFADQQELFPQVRAAGCLRYDLGNCLGPCVAAVTQDRYAERVRGVRRFLAGTDNAPLVRLEREMVLAAKRLHYEKAAGLRDVLDDLLWIAEHLQGLRLAKGEYSFIYPIADADADASEALWYLIHGGIVTGVVRAPNDAKAGRRLAPELERRFAQPPVDAGPKQVRELDLLLLVAGWFRAHPEELERTLTLAQALAICEAPRRRRRGKQRCLGLTPTPT